MNYLLLASARWLNSGYQSPEGRRILKVERVVGLTVFVMCRSQGNRHEKAGDGIVDNATSGLRGFR